MLLTLRFVTGSSAPSPYQYVRLSPCFTSALRSIQVHSSAGLQTKDIPWGVRQALIIGFVGFLGLQLVMGLLVGVIVSQLSVSSSVIDSNVFTFSFYALSTLVAATPIWLFFKRRRLSWADLGFDKPRLAKLWLVLPAFGIYFVAATLLYQLFLVLAPSVDLNQAQELGFTVTQQLPQLALIFISLVIIPPLVEETIFRGFIFRGLRTQLAFWPAGLIDGVGFGLAHWQLNIGLDTAVLGVASCWLYERTGSLWPCVALHALKNLIAFALKFVFSV